MEIASTTFDDGEKYRMEEFLDKRTVSVTAPLIRDGKEMKSGKRQVSGISNRACNHTNAVEEISEKVRVQILKKSKKSYPLRTGLVVYYDDISNHFRANDYEKIRSMCKETEPIWKNNFDVLFAVGITNTELIEI